MSHFPAHPKRDAAYDAANMVRLSPDVELGEGVRMFSFVNAYGCKIGDGSQIGAFVEIQRGAVIGKRCKISSHTFICEGVEIDDECFIGHGVMFINDREPAAVNSDGSLKGASDWTCERTLLRKRVNIGLELLADADVYFLDEPTSGPVRVSISPMLPTALSVRPRAMMALFNSNRTSS